MRAALPLLVALYLSGSGLAGLYPFNPARAAPAQAPMAALSRAVSLVPHHAVYNLSLQSSLSGSVVAADGTMDYQLNDACEAWATAQRLNVDITNNDGSVSHMISDYVTWERKDGRLLRFGLRQTSNGKLVANIQGQATREPDGSGWIHYTAPALKIVALPAGTLFPLAQTIALLDGATKGRKFLGAPLFDGTDENGAEDSFAVMGAFGESRAERVGDDPSALGSQLLRQVANGRVAISFFDRSNSEDNIPNYEVAMRYWQNGVSDDVAMDFGDFVIRATLAALNSNGKRC